ncbi:MAG: hypothetical protein OXC83_06225 [Chloroflexi bacterium]|nr:hypothetical protein [Chloroflexota bacterium]
MAKREHPQITKRDWFVSGSGILASIAVLATIAVIVCSPSNPPSSSPAPTPIIIVVTASPTPPSFPTATPASATATPLSKPTVKPTRVPPTRKPQPTRVSTPKPQQQRVPGWDVEERCIEHFMVMNQRGRYAPGMMSDDIYLRTMGRVMEWGLTRTQCGLIWDSLR